jgi:hypothetical protein
MLDLLKVEFVQEKLTKRTTKFQEERNNTDLETAIGSLYIQTAAMNLLDYDEEKDGIRVIIEVVKNINE